jgi:hypothetical protein
MLVVFMIVNIILFLFSVIGCIALFGLFFIGLEKLGLLLISSK